MKLNSKYFDSIRVAPRREREQREQRLATSGPGGKASVQGTDRSQSTGRGEQRRKHERLLH